MEWSGHQRINTRLSKLSSVFLSIELDSIWDVVLCIRISLFKKTNWYYYINANSHSQIHIFNILKLITLGNKWLWNENMYLVSSKSMSCSFTSILKFDLTWFWVFCLKLFLSSLISLLYMQLFSRMENFHVSLFQMKVQVHSGFCKWAVAISTKHQKCQYTNNFFLDSYLSAHICIQWL